MRRWRKKGLPETATQKEMQSLLEEYGWKRTIGGSHSVKMEMEGRRPITLPMHRGKKYSKGLTTSILKQAGLR